MMDSLELVAPSLRVPKEIRDMTVYLFGDEDVTGWRRRLDAGGGVDDGPDDREVLVGGADLADGGLARVDPDADPAGLWLAIFAGRRQSRFFPASLLDLHPRQHGLPRVVLAHDREAEDGQDRVANELVDDSVPLPHRHGACVIEAMQHFNGPRLSDAFREGGVVPQVGKQDGRGDDDLFLPLHLREHRFADGAQVGVHLADADPAQLEGNGERPANGDGHAHVLPASYADERLHSGHDPSSQREFDLLRLPDFTLTC